MESNEKLNNRKKKKKKRWFYLYCYFTLIRLMSYTFVHLVRMEGKKNEKTELIIYRWTDCRWTDHPHPALFTSTLHHHSHPHYQYKMFHITWWKENRKESERKRRKRRKMFQLFSLNSSGYPLLRLFNLLPDPHFSPLSWSWSIPFSHDFWPAISWEQ